ncbi:hypothetical protein Tco_0432595 [Tanacetum coccineum]
MGLWYPKDSGFELKAFADADYQDVMTHGGSTSGSAQFLGHRLVSWMLCSNPLDAFSLRDNVILRSTKFPMYYDNQSAILLFCNSVQHSRSKHIDIRHHFIKSRSKGHTVADSIAERLT